MKNGYQEAISTINSMIYDGTPEPTTRIKGTVFDEHLTSQLQKRALCALTNEQIKQKLEVLNELERARYAQVQEWEAGKRKRITLGPKLEREVKQLTQELHAFIIFSASRRRFEVTWK